jgi:hypothetical protein
MRRKGPSRQEELAVLSVQAGGMFQAGGRVSSEAFARYALGTSEFVDRMVASAQGVVIRIAVGDMLSVWPRRRVETACTCGLALVKGLAGMGAALGAEFAGVGYRVGIAVGPCMSVVRDGDVEGVLGEVVNLAERIAANEELPTHGVHRDGDVAAAA